MATVYEGDIQITMRGVADPVGLPYTVNPLELVDREAIVEIREGAPGDPGPQGDASWPWQWQGDATDFDELLGLGLGYADARKAWRAADEDAIYLWTGMDWIRFVDAFNTSGRQGPPNMLTGVAVAGAPGSSADATLTGTAPNQILTITIPRGETGDEGDPGEAGALADAVDVDVTDARDNSVLAWDDTASLWRPRPNPRLAGPWAIGSGQFGGASNLAVDRTIATITIPAQPIAWRPIVIAGNISIKCHSQSLDDTRAIVQVRLGSAEGPVIAFGQSLGATNNTMVLMCPRWEQALTPDSTHATVQPNQTATLFVVTSRSVGSRTYTVTTQGAQLMIMAQPLKAQP
ncbi:hypothetical protein IU487_22455 [Nocardia puris]|uniref:hypothetical protein n=1 Tax=Nocardia puris TaxID=208602 RepID=UPI001893BFB9|nr:hypothetical protein [Nocardia puris]MBF6213783.1 hypothetical protein [Nocardia puris]